MCRGVALLLVLVVVMMMFTVLMVVPSRRVSKQIALNLLNGQG